MDNISVLERLVTEYREAAAEAARKAALRASALEKLSKEERQALGL